MIKAIITDFDGTLIDTFEANFRAYQDAFSAMNLSFTVEKYHEYFGYRFDKFMQEMDVNDEKIATQIKEYKKNAYSKYFEYLIPNNKLIELISTFHQMGGKTAIASTASRENLMNAVNYLGIANHFDLIYTGEDVKQGKPSPEIYIKAMEALGVKSHEVMIFEDSPVGFQAAKESGANYIPITANWFE